MVKTLDFCFLIKIIWRFTISRKNKLSFLFVLLIFICFLIIQSFSQTQSEDFLSEIAAARKEVIETNILRIEKLDLGSVCVGGNRFTALIKNKTDRTLTIGLDLRTDPGLWLRKWQTQFVFQIEPQVETQIEANYHFLHMSPEAWLRIRFGVPVMKDGGIIEIKDLFFEKKYYVGKGNKAVNYNLSQFEKHQTEHYEIYCYKDSLASKEINAIIEKRESAFRHISDLLYVNYSGKIRIFFYPDPETKKKDTGHIGDGWAFSNIIVEIYNEKTKLDPFHELAHIIASKLGDPPAMFNEGFAVYISEKLGADALKYLGSPRRTIDQATRDYIRSGELIPLDELFCFTEIGSEKSKPQVAYPQAASIVKYLIETYGIQKFRESYQRLENTYESESIKKNKEIFREIYGKSLSEMELEWLSKLK